MQTNLFAVISQAKHLSFLSSNADLMLAQRLRRWTNIKTTSAQRLVVYGYPSSVHPGIFWKNTLQSPDVTFVPVVILHEVDVGLDDSSGVLETLPVAELPRGGELQHGLLHELFVLHVPLAGHLGGAVQRAVEGVHVHGVEGVHRAVVALYDAVWEPPGDVAVDRPPTVDALQAEQLVQRADRSHVRHHAGQLVLW